jgi:hypothetical protein
VHERSIKRCTFRHKVHCSEVSGFFWLLPAIMSVRYPSDLVTTAVPSTVTGALIERWRGEYNKLRPHSTLEYRPVAPEIWVHLTQGKSWY